MEWAPGASREVLALRARLLSETRRFFADREVLEVQTPVLVSAPCPDPAIPGIVATPADGRRMFLHTSPEHAMKRLLCAGSGDIYQICPVFRDGETGRRHNPEFTMIEWYRLGQDERALAAETVALLRRLLGTQAPADRLSYRDAFRNFAGVDPFACDARRLAEISGDRGVEPPAAARGDVTALLDLLLGTVVTPALEPNRFTVLHDFPVAQASLARIRKGAVPVAERFEVFFGGVELANGFSELTDADEQRRRFEAEQARHAEATVPLDERLLAALAAGLPDCSGVAVGFDRVVMLAAGTDRLSAVMPFAYDRI